MAQITATKISKAGILLGIGLGGFVDGIVLHQIFQWHNMVSNWIPPHIMLANHGLRHCSDQ
jgi:uncharacterized membrane protein